MTTSNFKEGPLSILLSARIRLQPEQRATLKRAYYDLRNASIPNEKPALNNSSIRVETHYSHLDVDKQVGMSQLTFSDLVNSRDTIALPVLLQLQRNLDVEVVTAEELMKASADYVSYCFEQFGSKEEPQEAATGRS